MPQGVGSPGRRRPEQGRNSMARKSRNYKLSRTRKNSRKPPAKKECEKLKQDENDELWRELAKETVRMASMRMDLLDE